MVTLKGATPTYIGLSDDNKPTDVPVNTIYTTLDTNVSYYYDGTDWQAVGGGSEANNAEG